ncbi:hypothetical protein BVX97_03860, partial [bacterium E08(2017)]
MAQKKKTSLNNIFANAENCRGHECPVFGEFLDESVDPIIIFNTERKILYMNKAIEELFGVKSSQAGTYDEWIMLCYPDEEQRKSIVESFNRDMDMKDPLPRLRKVEASDGTTRWFSRRIRKLSDGSIMMIGQDVTDFKLAERSLEQANFAIENAADAIMWVNAEGNYTYANRKSCEMLGYNRVDILKLTVRDIDPLMSIKQWEKFWEMVREKKDVHIETINKRKDGSTLPVEVTFSYNVFSGQEFLFTYTRDITERKKSDQALLESERSIRQLADVAFEALVIHDEGKLINANDRWFDMHGYTREELEGKDIVELTVSPKLLKEVRKRIDDGHRGYFESINVRKDGTEFPVEIRIRVMEYEGKSVRVAAIQDITDRKHAEESLKESETKFRHIIESSPIGMFMYRLEPDGRLILTDVNPAANKLTGADNNKHVGSTIEEAFPALAGTEVPDRYREAAAKGTPWYNEVVEYEDDVIKGAFEVYAFQTSPNTMVASFWNITERKEAESELLRLVAAVESAAESIVVTDALGNISYVNPWFEQMTGYHRDEVLKKHIRCLKSGKHDESFYADLWQTLLSGETWHGHFINRKKDGTLFEEDAAISPVKDSSGEIVNFVAVKRDVTQEMLLESQVVQSQKMAAIGQLSHKVAHNFTNILVMILGNAQLAKEMLPPNSEAVQFINEVVNAANRVSTLTAELLAFAHPTELALKTQKLRKALLGV